MVTCNHRERAKLENDSFTWLEPSSGWYFTTSVLKKVCNESAASQSDGTVTPKTYGRKGLQVVSANGLNDFSGDEGDLLQANIKESRL